MTRTEYFKFFNQVTDIIDFFVKLQQLCEELYITGQFEFDDDPNGDN